VLDGGALLHRIPWGRGETYDLICGRYVKYVTDKYGCATLVFDGYESGPSTKDMTHGKRIRSGIGAGDMVRIMKKDCFLPNKSNKQRFINLLALHLKRRGINVLHAGADVDVLVVQTAVASAERHNTVLDRPPCSSLFKTSGHKIGHLLSTRTQVKLAKNIKMLEH